jgi:phosphoribosyl-ATP pyrophosphohydrolase
MQKELAGRWTASRARCPSLIRAHKLGKRAAGVNFDWPNTTGVRDKVREELAELDDAVSNGEGDARMSEELGDLLFVIANWARHLGLDAEAALRGANAKFERRFAFIEAAAAQQSLALPGLSAQQWETLWQAAKHAEKASAGTNSGSLNPVQSPFIDRPVSLAASPEKGAQVAAWGSMEWRLYGQQERTWQVGQGRDRGGGRHAGGRIGTG